MVFVVSGHRDPENRVRHQILRILVVGELRGMSFSYLMQNCATNRLRQVLLAPTIRIGMSWDFYDMFDGFFILGGLSLIHI